MELYAVQLGLTERFLQNDTYYVIEAVPDTTKNTAYIVSAYMNKKGVAPIADNAAASPARTSSGNDVNTLSDNQTPETSPSHSNTSIAEKTENVNTKSPSSEISNYVEYSADTIPAIHGWIPVVHKSVPRFRWRIPPL